MPIISEEQKKEFETTKARMDLIDMLNTAIRVMRLNQKSAIETADAFKSPENYLLKIEFPKEGGVLCYYSQHQYPTKGFFYHETVDKLDIVKKIFTIWFSQFDNLMRKHKLQTLLGFLFFKRQLYAIVQELFNYAFWVLAPERLKPDKYCQFVREVYRTFNKINPDNNAEIEKLRDIICVFLEFDDAYRYRLQDAVSILKIKKENNKPIPMPLDNFSNIPFFTFFPVKVKTDTDFAMEKFWQVLERLEEREKYDHMKMRWRVIKRLFKLLRFYPNIQNKLAEFLYELNIEECKLSKEDKYHSMFKESYLFE